MSGKKKKADQPALIMNQMPFSFFLSEKEIMDMIKLLQENTPKIRKNIEDNLEQVFANFPTQEQMNEFHSKLDNLTEKTNHLNSALEKLKK